MRLKRILFATARYPPDRGGTEIHTREVAQRLAQRGIDVTVVCTTRDGSEREDRDGDVRLLHVRAWPRTRDWYAAPGLVRAVRRGRPDLVHCQGYHTLVPPLAMLSARSIGTRYVLTLHSGGHSSAVRRTLRPLQTTLLRPLLSRAERIVAVSDFEADLFARRLRLPRESFSVIPSGVDLPEPASGPVPPGDPLILSVGRVERYKGHHRVVEVLPQLAQLYPDVRLRVVGSGPYEEEIRQLAAELGVAGRLEIAAVPVEERDEMARLFRAARAVVLLSQYESQGLAVQEAMALGKPLVITAASALEQVASHPNVRAVAPDAAPADVLAAILELLEQPPVQAPPMPTWDACADALVGLYEDVLERTG
jgi:glycosyltransferase involved in cell wall biosynthesis